MTEQNRNENETPREEPTTPEEQQNSSEAAAAEAGDDELPVISEDELNSLLEEAMANASASDSPAADGADADASGTADEASSDAQAGDEANDDPHGYLADLKRLQADYANYRRRTDREKDELADITTGKVVKQLLPVLDDLDRAEAAGDLEVGTPMEVIATKFRSTIAKLGVERYGEAGEAFDPQVHEAVAQLPNPEVTEATIADVVEVGYRIGNREIRPAKVAVFVAAE